MGNFNDVGLWVIDNSDMAKIGLSKLTEYEGKLIRLLTLEELRNIKKYCPRFGLIDIFGKVIEAKDANEDTRAGHVAYGTLTR